MDYEIIEIPKSESAITEYKYVESDWMVICHYGECYEYNRKTGETREITVANPAIKVANRPR